MKRIVFLLSAITTFGISSCILILEEKDCEKNNTADVTVTNDNPFAITVDVLYPGSGSVNEEVSLQPGNSKKYTIPAGNSAIWVNQGNGWVKIKEQTVDQCQEFTYNYAFCSYGTNNYAKEVSVKNNTSSTIIVDVYSDGFAGEITLQPNQTAHYYNVKAGNSVKFWAKVLPNGEWREHQTNYTIAKCETFTFTWIDKSVKDGNKTMEKPFIEYNPFVVTKTLDLKENEPAK
ncbi:MAG TPA: hypothetical protein PK990_08670 [Salinivirgaceae bacterium]|nr:hypothetical protein [Salinivirgaceae bacterium]